MSKKFTKKLQKSISTMVMITTIVWMSGIAMIAPVFVVDVDADEFSNNAEVSDVTGTSPKIAANGESALAVLGIDATRVDTTDNIELNGVKVVLNSDDTAEEAVIANIETIDIYADSSSGTNGAYDSSDSLIRSVTRTMSGASSSVSITAAVATTGVCIDATTANGLVTGDMVKIGEGATAEIRTLGTSTADNDCSGANVGKTKYVVPALTYAHAIGDKIREINDEEAVGTEGFTAYGTETTVTIGTFGGANDTNINWNVLKTNSGNTAGNDLFVRLTTALGVADQTIKAKIVPGGIEYYKVGTAVVTVTGNSTDNETKSVTFGTDAVAPTIEKVEAYDNTPDGVVDRVIVYFSESMASGITETNNFTDILGGTGTASTINAIESGTPDVSLNATGSWTTTTNLNDTFTINITNATVTPYGNATNSTGDTWSVVYDKNLTAFSLTDATGTELEDQTISTTDMALPYLVSAEKYDLDSNGQIDELRVMFSESLGATSDASGLLLKNTTLSPQVTYTLGAVNGFVKGTTDANDNDTIKIAVTESGSNDLSDTFSLAYTSGQTIGILDVAGKEAVSRSGVTPSLAAYPTITKIEIKDGGPNGYIESALITFSCAVTSSGVLTNFAVAGYANDSFANPAGSTTATLTFDPGTVYDTNAIPDITYVGTSTDYIYCTSGSTDYKMENVNADTIIEQDKAAPVLISATLYETDSDDVWDSGETVQLFFSEPIDPTSIATSWSGSAIGDFTDTLTDPQTPTTGTISVNGSVVTLTALENGVGALDTGDTIVPATNEVKDSAGNSAVDNVSGITLTVTPTTAPTAVQINTLDENDNGVVDALAINFNGIVDGSTIIASDFAAARGSNFSIAAVTEAATSTSAITPDLTINEVVTQNGGNDSTVIVRFTEVGEDTAAHPQVKYVKGSLADLAGNKIATLNAYSSDNTKFEETITTSAKDKVAPKVMEIRLKDRNANNKFDQLMVTYSETVKNDLGTLVNGVLSSTGWAVADHTISASGNVYDNTNMALTYATTNAVFKADINEVSGNETAVPEVTFSGSGVTKDEQDNPLAAIAAGDVTEVSEVSDLTSELVDGDVARIGTAAEVYIVKIVGANKYKRHIVSPEVFNSYGHLSWSAIKSVSNLDAYSLSAWVRNCTGANGTPAATDKVYEVNADSTMHWLNMTAAQFYARGGSDEAIYNVNAGELGLYTLGVDVLYE